MNEDSSPEIRQLSMLDMSGSFLVHLIVVVLCAGVRLVRLVLLRFTCRAERKQPPDTAAEIKKKPTALGKEDNAIREIMMKLDAMDAKLNSVTPTPSSTMGMYISSCGGYSREPIQESKLGIRSFV